MFLTCPQHDVSSWVLPNRTHSSRPRVPIEWKVRQQGNTFKTFSIPQLREDWEQLSANRGECYQCTHASEQAQLNGGPDFEGTMTELTIFPSFLALPQELQDEIWKYSCNEPRRHQYVDKKVKNSVSVSKNPCIPPLLHTSTAARRLGLKIYLRLPMMSGKIYFNPKVDIICFGRDCSDITNAIEWLAKNPQVRYLECNITLCRVWLHKWHQNFFDALCKSSNLKEITFFNEAREPPELLMQIIKNTFELIWEINGRKVPELKFAVQKMTEDTHRDEFI
jgi:hypothetical protein